MEAFAEPHKPPANPLGRAHLFHDSADTPALMVAYLHRSPPMFGGSTTKRIAAFAKKLDQRRIFDIPRQ
jgi:hypothetical protein